MQRMSLPKIYLSLNSHNSLCVWQIEMNSYYIPIYHDEIYIYKYILRRVWLYVYTSVHPFRMLFCPWHSPCSITTIILYRYILLLYILGNIYGMHWFFGCRHLSIDMSRMSKLQCMSLFLIEYSINIVFVEYSCWRLNFRWIPQLLIFIFQGLQ